MEFKTEYKKYLQSDKWKFKREELFKLRGEKCEKCNSIELLHVHHKNYDNIFNEKTDDLVILCSSCHRLQHLDLNKKIRIEERSTTGIKIIYKNKSVAKRPSLKDKLFLKQNNLKLMELYFCFFLKETFSDSKKFFVNGDFWELLEKDMEKLKLPYKIYSFQNSLCRLKKCNIVSRIGRGIYELNIQKNERRNNK